jgi:hypothetical protein
MLDPLCENIMALAETDNLIALNGREELRAILMCPQLAMMQDGSFQHNRIFRFFVHR